VRRGEVLALVDQDVVGLGTSRAEVLRAATAAASATSSVPSMRLWARLVPSRNFAQVDLAFKRSVVSVTTTGVSNASSSSGIQPLSRRARAKFNVAMVSTMMWATSGKSGLESPHDPERVWSS
jgi:hypothetical protein